MTKTVDWEKVQKVSQKLRAENKVLVSTNGCFDILHRGHVEYLERARDLGDFLVVGVNSDRSVKALKGESRPINTAEDRAHILSALACVDAVCIFDEDTPLKWLETIKPQIHVKGGDYKPDAIPETACLKKWGGEVMILPFVEGYSTTTVIERMKGS